MVSSRCKFQHARRTQRRTNTKRRRGIRSPFSSSLSLSFFFRFSFKKVNTHSGAFFSREERGAPSEKKKNKAKKREKKRDAIYRTLLMRTNFEPTFVSLSLSPPPLWKCMVFLKRAIELDLRISKRTKCRWARCSSSK